MPEPEAPAGERLGAVSSPDGTLISYEPSGQGPPIVLVHGTGSDRTVWRAAAKLLAERLTVYNVDRRGRNESGDAEPYAMEREVEDLVAIMESLPERGTLLGHSYGAILSLEAALRTDRIARLVLFEPPMRGSWSAGPDELLARAEALMERGDREGIVALFCLDIIGMSQRRFEAVRQARSWPERLASAHTIPREMRASRDYALEPGRFRDLQTPTLLLLGGESPERLRTATESVHAALPNSRLEVLEGQRHLAMYTAPQLFAEVVLRFVFEGGALVASERG